MLSKIVDRIKLDIKRLDPENIYNTERHYELKPYIRGMLRAFHDILYANNP